MCIVVSVALHGEFERFSGLALTVITHQIGANSPCRATETTIDNSWSRFTFILSFNLDIPRYKFTILRHFNILPYISLYLKETTRQAVCVGSLWFHLSRRSDRVLDVLDEITFRCQRRKLGDLKSTMEEATGNRTANPRKEPCFRKWDHQGTN